MYNDLILKDNHGDFFELTTYPDGQHNIKLLLDKLDVKKPVKLRCRIKTFAELEVLLCIVSALTKNDFNIAHLTFMYLFGLRSDRAFNVGMPNYVRDVLAPIINTMQKNNYIKHIKFFFPHNDNINNYLLKSSSSFYEIDYLTSQFFENIIIFGDESASLHIGFLRQYTNITKYFLKKRSIAGNIEVKLAENYPPLLNFSGTYNFIIVDDLCDGGATYIAEAKYLKDNYPKCNLTLFVAHGIFSRGLHELFFYYDKIITTNSYQDFENYQYPKDQLEIIEVFK